MKDKFNVISYLLCIFKYWTLLRKSCTERIIRYNTGLYFLPTIWQRFDRPHTLKYLWTIKVVCWTYNILYKELQSTQVEMVSVYLLTLPWLFPVYYRTDRRHNLTTVLEETSVLHILSAHHPHSELERDGENVCSTSVLLYLITNNFMANLFIYFWVTILFQGIRVCLFFIYII